MSSTAKSIFSEALKIQQPQNGQIISAVILDLCEKEKPKSVLFIRTPTTGAFLDQLSLPNEITLVRIKYAEAAQQQQQQTRSAAGGPARSAQRRLERRGLRGQGTPRHGALRRGKAQATGRLAAERHVGEAYLQRETYVAAMQAMAQRGERFDLIAVDPFHEYASSRADFELCIALLADDGVLLSHDCAPASLALAAPTFTQGSWCGLTYAALVTLAAKHPELAVTVLDTDYGIGIVQRRSSIFRSQWLPPVPSDQEKQSEFQMLLEDQRFDETYLFFREHGTALIGLVGIDPN